MGTTYYKKIMIDFHFFFLFRTFPANICWSTRHVLKTSSACLQHNSFFFVFLEEIMQDVLRTFKTSSRHLGRQKILCWKRLEDITWRRLQGMSWSRLEYMSWKRLQDTLETNKMFSGDVRCYITNLYLTNLYLTKLNEIQNALIRAK